MSGIRRSVIDQVEQPLAERVQGRPAVAGRLDLVPVQLEDHAEVFANQRRVVHDQDAAFHEALPLRLDQRSGVQSLDGGLSRFMGSPRVDYPGLLVPVGPRRDRNG